MIQRYLGCNLWYKAGIRKQAPDLSLKSIWMWLGKMPNEITDACLQGLSPGSHSR